MSTYDDKKTIYKTLSDKYTSAMNSIKYHNTGFSMSRRTCWNACSELIQLQTLIHQCEENEIPVEMFLWAKNRLITIQKTDEYLSE